MFHRFFSKSEVIVFQCFTYTYCASASERDDKEILTYCLRREK